MAQLALNLSSFSDINESFIDYITALKGAAIHQDEDVTYYVNEYWTAKQRQSHSLHEISYRACFKAELPRFFIEKLTKLNDLIYDPFMGRGTSLLEGALLGRRVTGNDINPLSKMLIAPRLNPPTLLALRERLLQIPKSAPIEQDNDLLAFYHEQTLGEICALKNWLLMRQEQGTFDDIDGWLRMVALNRLTGHSTGFFSVYTMPPNQAVSLKSQLKINEKRNQTPQYRNVAEIIIKKSKALLRDPLPFKNTQAQLTNTGAKHNKALFEASIDLVITSPPFLDIVNYKQDNWLRCWFAGINIDDVEISTHKKLEYWEAFVRECLIDFTRLVKPNGHIAFEVGEVRGGKILLEKNVINAAKDLPLTVLGVIVHAQDFTKTANCWGVNNNTSGTNTNRIVVMRRD